MRDRNDRNECWSDLAQAARWIVAAALPLLMASCASAPRPVPGIRISQGSEEPGEPIAVHFDKGADGQEVVRQLLVTARARGASAVSGLEFHFPIGLDGKRFDCISIVGTADDAYARANRWLERPGAFVPQPRSDRPVQCDRQVRGSVLPLGSGCRSDGWRYTSSTRYAHLGAHRFTPVDWKRARGAYTDEEIVTELQVCVPGKSRRELRAAMHFEFASE